MTTFRSPAPDTILTGPFWPEAVRVIRATRAGPSIRLQTESVNSGKYDDRTLSAEQFELQVRELVGGLHQFDAEPRLFRLATEALRTHLAHAFDPEFAVSVSQVDPLPHQLDAVYKHLLPLPRIRFLLADDPGAGKTIMAGLAMRELMQRGDVRRVLVLCPKALTDQWRREMLERFHENFTLLTGETVSASFGRNPWVTNDLIVASVDLAVQEHILPGLEQATWDMIIFDEAHKLSAYRYGTSSKIDKTKRYQLAERLSPKTKHLLLMTATPHKGDDENFRLLLSLLDEQVFSTLAGMRSALQGEDSPYYLRRMKEAMRHFDGRPLFLPRHVDTVKYELEPHEQALYEAVTNYVSTGLQQAESTQNRNVGLALTILQRRLASSVFAITRSLERRHKRLSDELEVVRKMGRLREQQQVDLGDEEDPEDPNDEQEDILSGASNARTPDELAAEIAQLKVLVALAHETRQIGMEKKLKEFLSVVEAQTVKDHNEKILVFTEHKDTLDYLTQQLTERGYSVCNIHGGMRLQDRIAAEKSFRGPTQFMVATDAAGEGINLQFCRVMVNWDLPWNPNRLEQRMGRIHRYGQDFEVEIVNLVAATTREGAVLIRLMEKLERMRVALGHDQVYDVISSVLEGGQIRLDTLIREAIINRRSLDDILVGLDAVDSDAAKALARQALDESLATANIDMAFIGGEQRESKERRLTPEYVERFFVDALTYLGGRAIKSVDLAWRLEFVPVELRRLVIAKNAGESGLENRLITFRKERGRRDPPAEFIAPDHPLFDVVAERMLEVGRPALARGTVFLDKETNEPYLLWLMETAVVNGEGQEVHRRLMALRQRGDHFERVEPGAVLDLAPADTAPAIPDAVRALANGDVAVSKATEFYVADYLTQVTKEQERQASIIERALQRSTNQVLTELQARLERQLVDQERGKDMGIAIRTTNQEIEQITRDFETRRQSLGRRKVTTIRTPQVVGVAAVIPAPVPAVLEGGRGGVDLKAVEMAAIDYVNQYERRNGREPEDVSKQGVGYDIKSVGAAGDVRYIEVKGHATKGDLALYYTEWQTANRMRGEFFIYDVHNAISDPELWITQDPVGKGVDALERVVEYLIRADQLEGIAERAL